MQEIESIGESRPFDAISRPDNDIVSSDVDWDIENDRDLCLRGLVSPKDESLDPGDVMRITDLFDSPTFFKDGASSSDIEQGGLDDCWFLSALATVATVPHLLDRICVERDEFVGVYGFVFFRDGYWTDVIIDEYALVSPTSLHAYWNFQSCLCHQPQVRGTHQRRTKALPL